MALFSHCARFLGQILTKEVKAAPKKNSLKRQHLLRCRNWYRCQPEDVPAALFFCPDVTVKDLDLAFGQATSRT